MKAARGCGYSGSGSHKLHSTGTPIAQPRNYENDSRRGKLEWKDDEKQCEVNETQMGKVSAGSYTDILCGHTFSRMLE